MVPACSTVGKSLSNYELDPPSVRLDALEPTPREREQGEQGEREQDSQVEVGGTRFKNLGADENPCTTTHVALYLLIGPKTVGTRGHLCRVQITTRHTSRSGELPHTALSDVGDPTERLAFRSAFRHWTRTALFGPSFGIGTTRDRLPLTRSMVSASPRVWPRPRRISARALGPDPTSYKARHFPSQRSSFLLVVRGRKMSCRGIKVSQKLIMYNFMFH